MNQEFPPPRLEEHSYQSAALEDCRILAADPAQAARLTSRFKTVAVITDGSKIRFPGESAPQAALPLVEAKCRLIRSLAGIEALPLAIANGGAEDAVRFLTALAPSIGAVNLEAMGEAVSMVIKRRMAEGGELPIYQDRLDGLPVICLAALQNALKVLGKKMSEIRLVITGGEADALALVNFLRLAGTSDIVVCDRLGAIHKGRPGPTNWVKEDLAARTNPRQLKGPLAKVAAGADALAIVGPLPAASKDWPPVLSEASVVLDLGDSPAETLPQAAVSASPSPGKPNFLSPSLIFPGVLKGILAARARQLNPSMKMAAAMALAGLVPETALGPEAVVPQVTKPNLSETIAQAVASAAAASGVGSLS
ncbi:MAG: hypothetical protein LBE49_08445 [Deltaproteobacteria bacterium]|jgi:malate dehydrogenase (oxaloacetate-decarboxylating)|nr:hypothetical protein [Deltaproteobacteria bacterium]